MESITELRLNQKDAAALLGINRRNLTREGDLAPREPDGTYLATELVAWFVDRGSELDEKIKTEKLRKLKRDNETAEGNLVDVNELFSWAEKLGAFIRQAGDLLARKNTITGREAQEILNSSVDEFDRTTQEFKDHYTDNSKDPNHE